MIVHLHPKRAGGYILEINHDKPTWNHENHENRLGTMKNQPETMKNQPGTMKNQPGTIKTMKTQLKP